MSRRLPPSAASRLVDALVARSPAVRWDDLPPLAASDEGAVLDSSGAAMRDEILGRCGPGELPSGGEFARLALEGALLTPYDVTMCARWRSCRQVYHFDATLAAELGGQGDGDAVPAEALRMLPYPIVYVEAPALEAPWPGGPVPARGFLAWVDRDPEGEHVEELVLCWAVPGRGPGGRASAYLPFDWSGTIADFARETARNDVEAFAEVGLDVEVGRDGFGECVGMALSLLLYIVSEEADVEVVYAPPSGGRDQRAGRRSSPETVHAVGARVGRALGEARRRWRQREGARTGRTVAPHVRSAHWQHYWVGPRRGRADGMPGDRLVLRWVAPTLVLGGGGEETVHEARMGEDT